MSTEILMPALSPTMEEGMIAKWLVKEGDFVSPGDLLAEIETDKAVMEFEAVDEGIVGKLIVGEGSNGVKVNEPIAILIEKGESLGNPHPQPPPESAVSGGESAKSSANRQKPMKFPDSAVPNNKNPDAPPRIFASPLARRIAKENGLNLASIEGSGPRGRIVKADVLSELSKPQIEPAPVRTGRKSDDELDLVRRMLEGRSFEEVKLDGMRKSIAARLAESKQTVPHFYLRREFRLDALLNMRAEANGHLAERGEKLSINDFLIKASALALQKVPDANSVWAGDRIFKLAASDVAVAVAVEGGLFTPIVRDAHAKSITEISKEMKDLAARARSRSLLPREYIGGSFSLSNLGMFGVENFDAIINPPHGSILAVGAAIEKPVFNSDGIVEKATVLSATLSVDHRTIDGALGARFLEAIKDYVESPLALLI